MIYRIKYFYKNHPFEQFNARYVCESEKPQYVKTKFADSKANTVRVLKIQNASTGETILEQDFWCMCSAMNLKKEIVRLGGKILDQNITKYALIEKYKRLKTVNEEKRTQRELKEQVEFDKETKLFNLLDK